jgi:hypothetical protein
MAFDEYSAARRLEAKLASFPKLEAEELKVSPDQIRAKWAKKRRDAVAEAPEIVRNLLLTKGVLKAEEVAAAIAPEKPAEPEAQAESAQQDPPAPTATSAHAKAR